ncbi:hypothetical protein [Cypionkella sp.]|uniref:hypothetical protein n=1 Tax=Cypionkella sp. TaxID=2811411 RepID=UPI002ABC9C94|nr:hypothetical protein [Cypionkella sp.]MDZ4393784.1 hypothetical protein [Cypionkella sp.]
MTDHTLHGNCEPCPACALRREALPVQSNAYGKITDHRHIFVECNECGGYGLKPIPVAEIIRRTCEEARRIYWPEFDRRIAG